MQLSAIAKTAGAIGIGAGVIATTATALNATENRDYAITIGATAGGIAAALIAIGLIGNRAGSFQQATRFAGFGMLAGAVGLTVGAPLIITFANANNPR